MFRLVTLLMLPWAALSGAASATPVISALLGADAPATLCLESSPPQDGSRRRAVLVIHALNGTGLTVTAETGQTSQIGIFPGQPFDSGTGAEPQRHFLPGGDQARCWQIAVQGGESARVGLEWSPALD